MRTFTPSSSKNLRVFCPHQWVVSGENLIDLVKKKRKFCFLLVRRGLTDWGVQQKTLRSSVHAARALLAVVPAGFFKAQEKFTVDIEAFNQSLVRVNRYFLATETPCHGQQENVPMGVGWNPWWSGMVWGESKFLVLPARQARLPRWVKSVIPHFLHKTWGLLFIFSTSRVFSVCLSSCLPHFFCLNSHSFFSSREFCFFSAQTGQVLLLPLTASFSLLFSQANLQSGSLVKNIHLPKWRFLTNALITWSFSFLSSITKTFPDKV